MIAMSLVGRAHGTQGDLRIGPPIPLGTRHGVWIENRGQWPEEIRYLCQFPGMLIRLECGAIGIQATGDGRTPGSYSRIVFEDGPHIATPTGVAPVDAAFSYYVGGEPGNWHSLVPAFSQAEYSSIRDGLNLVLRTEGNRLIYDVTRSSTLVPADPLVSLDGPSNQQGGAPMSLPLSAAWSLALATPSMSRSAAAHVPTSPGWSGSANLQSPSPGLLWSTYLGSTDTQGFGTRAETAAWNDAGEVAVAGIADLLGFPVTPGAYQGITASSGLVFLAKFRGRDGALVYSALLGGLSTGDTHTHDLALDARGQATIVGQTSATDFPTTPGALDPVRSIPGGDAGIITQFSAGGDALNYSTYLESEGSTAVIRAVALHPSGGVVIAGGAITGVFPTTPGAFQTTFRGQTGDSFVGLLNATGSAFQWMTLLGGTRSQTARDVALTHDGRPVVLSWTASRDYPVTPGAFQTALGNWVQSATVVTVLNSDASALDWSTFIAGNTPGEFDEPWRLALDGDDSVFVTGSTNADSFPVTPGSFQTVRPPPDGSNVVSGYVTRLDPTGSSLVYSTFITGTVNGSTGTIFVDPSGVATVTGGGVYAFPTTPGAYDSTPNLNNPSFFRLAPAGDRLFYFTHIGGPGSDSGQICANSRGRVTLAGWSTGGHPTTPNAVQPNYAAGQTNAFVTTLDPVLRGIQQFGESTSSCRGVLQMNSSEMPAAGAATFSVWCSGAPPSARGMLVFGSPRSAPAFVGGAQLWIDLSRPTTRIPVVADSHGFVETTIPLPATATGRKAAAQYVFRSTSTCGTGRGACSSNGLRIEVQ